MTTDLYLIAHKVRGEPAFDVAERMECPVCNGDGAYNKDEGGTFECHECNLLGYWWIIPTSGHRAYPWWSIELWELSWMWDGEHNSIMKDISSMPEGLPDHYPTASTPTIDLATVLGLGAKPAAPTKPFPRRI